MQHGGRPFFCIMLPVCEEVIVPSFPRDFTQEHQREREDYTCPKEWRYAAAWIPRCAARLFA